jgi:hypothetical protein
MKAEGSYRWNFVRASPQGQEFPEIGDILLQKKFCVVM